MTIPILAAVLGLLVAALSIGIPQLIRRRYQAPDDSDDSRAYLKGTGKSGRDIASGNAALASRQQAETKDDGSDDRPPQ